LLSVRGAQLGCHIPQAATSAGWRGRGGGGIVHMRTESVRKWTGMILPGCYLLVNEGFNVYVTVNKKNI